MNGRRIRNIIRKEWAVLSGDAATGLLIGFVPFMILLEGFVVARVGAAAGGQAILDNSFFQGALNKLIAAQPAVAGLPPLDRVGVLLVTQVNFFLLLIPTMIAVYSASYSIVEEKLSRSLEPLLATPVRTSELLLGKALAGAIPAFVMTWVCAGVYLLAITVSGWARLLPYVVTANWYLDFLLLAPGIALLSFLLGVIGSSRAKDFRNAQNLVLFIILPVFALIAVQITGVVWFTPLTTVLLAVGVFVVDAIVLRVAVRLFQRESIIVRWR